MKKYSRSIKGFGFMLLCLMLLSGCGYIPVSGSTKLIKKTRYYASTGKLLIMPPHDAVKGGEAHPKGKGSGKQLQDSIVRELKKASTYEVIVYEANDRFNFTTNIKIEDAIAESKKIGPEYCLILSLGEFRDASPLTRLTIVMVLSDFLVLDRGVLVDVNSGKEVWLLRKPFILTKNNWGGYYRLIDKIAIRVVKSITDKSITE